MSRMVARPVPSIVMTCRPPLALASSENATWPLGLLAVMSTCTEPPAVRAARAALSRPAADMPAGGALAGAAGDRMADAAGDAPPLPPEVQPASIPSPSSANTVRVIALAGDGRCVLMMTCLSPLRQSGRDRDRTAMRTADLAPTFSDRLVTGLPSGVGRPAREPMVTAPTSSEERWLRVHAFLSRDRYELANRAARDYPPELRVAGTSLLAPPAWRLAAPVPLDGIGLEFDPDAPPPDVPDLAALAPGSLSERADGTRFARYSDVVAALAAPVVFENRPVYRLIEADLAGAHGPRLVFGRGRYFDSIDAGGAAGHEYAAARLGEIAAARAAAVPPTSSRARRPARGRRRGAP